MSENELIDAVHRLAAADKGYYALLRGAGADTARWRSLVERALGESRLPAARSVVERVVRFFCGE